MVGAIMRDRRAERLFGFVKMAVAAECHAERIPGRRVRRIDGNRVAKAGDRPVDLSAIALQLAEPLTDGRVLRQKWKRGFERGFGFTRSIQAQAQVRVEDRELPAV